LRGWFVTGTGTGAGKTLLTRGLALSLVSQGRRVAALKPIETGWSGEAGSDAEALARAVGHPEFVNAAGFYRAAPPLAPAAVTLAGGAKAPAPDVLAAAVRRAAAGFELCLVEGAGGLLVPLDSDHTLADLALSLGLPLLVAAPDGLGVLSHVLTASESAQRRGLAIAAVVLMQIDGGPDASRDESRNTNREILASRLPCPVLRFSHLSDHSDQALIAATQHSGLLDALAD